MNSRSAEKRSLTLSENNPNNKSSTRAAMSQKRRGNPKWEKKSPEFVVKFNKQSTFLDENGVFLVSNDSIF